MKRFVTLVALSVLIIGIGVAAASRPLRIGISKIVEHPALDAVQQGVIDRLTALGYVEGQDVEYIIASAQGDMSLATAMFRRSTSADGFFMESNWVLSG